MPLPLGVLAALVVCRTLAAPDIFEAVQADDVRLVQAALDKGAELNAATGPGGQTPLMHGALMGSAQVVDFLLQEGADPTIGEKDGYTPMHGAGFQGRADVVRVLVKHGLDANDMHTDGARQVALPCSPLRGRGVCRAGYLPMHRACWGRVARHTETVRAFLEAGVAVDEPSRDGKTCLQVTKNDDTKALLQTWGQKDSLVVLYFT